jgi:hypothetical protein
MPVGEPKKKRRRDRNQRKINERTQCQDGCRGKLVVARRGTSHSAKVAQRTPIDRKVSRRATVVWRERNVFKKSLTPRNCGPRKEVTATGMKITCCAGHKRMGENKNKVAMKTIKKLTFGKRLWKGPECITGIRDIHIYMYIHTYTYTYTYVFEGSDHTVNSSFQKSVDVPSEDGLY